MLHRELGTSGIEVSALGFGAMRLPTTPDGKVDEKEALRVIHRAFDLGVNYIDSAWMYHGGESEVVVGRAIKQWQGDKVYVSTKNPYREESGDEWMKHLDTQLERLGMDHIDFYLFHGLPWNAYEKKMSGPGGPIEMAQKALDDGKIGHICFSCHDKPDNMIKLLDTGLFTSVTLQYNLLNQENEPVIAHAAKNGVGVIVMGPVGGGKSAPHSEAITKAMPGGAKSTAEVAMRFVVSNPNVTMALSGMNAVEQVEENAEICSHPAPLTAEQRAEVESALTEMKELADLYCTGCNYCMPCPNEVNIPQCFTYMNLHRVYGQTDYAREQYEKFRQGKGGPWAKGKAGDACVECGECEDKCPQDIPIIEQLKQTGGYDWLTATPSFRDTVV